MENEAMWFMNWGWWPTLRGTTEQCKCDFGGRRKYGLFYETPRLKYEILSNQKITNPTKSGFQKSVKSYLTIGSFNDFNKSNKIWQLFG